MDFFSFEREGGFKQCNMMFKTNEPTNPANISVEYFQIGGVPHPPHGPLRVSGH